MCFASVTVVTIELSSRRDDARDAHEDADGFGDREIRARATKRDDAMRGDASRCV